MKRITPLIAVLLLILATAAIAIWRLDPPSHDNSKDGFDTSDALAHLAVIAREPHPLGSPANERVRQYLIQQFRMLALEVRSPEQKVTLRRGGRSFDYVTRNVVARLRGNGQLDKPGHAVMLSAHYDSVEQGPGAGDDGAAVAALLEVARVLSRGPALKRDVIFLITDGEEEDLLGARAFVTMDEWKGEPGVVFNFEARGASGPSVMFETSRGNGWLVEQYADVAPHPVTSSISAEVYARMPNDTDFTIFRQAGIEGLNFAFIGSEQHYHQPTDNVENLDARSLRHHGQQALALVRRFANLDQRPVPDRAGAVIYFDVLGFSVVHYPRAWSRAITIVMGFWWIALLLYCVRHGRPRVRHIVVGVLAPLLSLAAVVGVCLLITKVFPHASNAGLTLPVTYGMLACAVVIPAILVRSASHTSTPLAMTAGGISLWVVLGVLAVTQAEGGSYLLYIPTIFFLAGLNLMLMQRRSTSAGTAFLIGCVVATMLIAPITVLAAQALTTRGAPYVMVLPGLVGCMTGALAANGVAKTALTPTTLKDGAATEGFI